jgi:predicted nucleic acid-binding protein
MNRPKDVYVIDAHAAIELVRKEFVGRDKWELFAPTLLRSQVLAILHAELVAKRGDPGQLLSLAERACRLPRRLLGDAVLRRLAWAIATEQGWVETYDAEYIALTRLHGVALVAGSAALREKAMAMVRTETVDHLLGGT